MSDSTFHYVNETKTFLYSSTTTSGLLPIAPHTHGGYEIYYFLSGDMSYFVEGKHYTASPHDLFITNHRELHTPTIHSDHPYGRCYIQFESNFLAAFDAFDYGLLSPLDHRPLGTANKIDHTFVTSYGIHKLFAQLETTLATPDRYTSLETQLLLTSILLAIKRISLHAMDAHAYQPTEEKIYQITHYIQDHIDTPLALDSLATTFYMNKYYLSHFFKKHTGFTLKEYILSKRILLAKTLILQGVPITEVCYAVGFNDYSCFYKAFTKLEHQSPKAFSQENRHSMHRLNTPK